MRFWQLLGWRLPSRQTVSFVGAGGKTTALFSLAAELRALGKTVLVTTTTAIMMPDHEPFDDLVVQPKLAALTHVPPGKRASITVFGSEETDDGKLQGISRESMSDAIRSGWFDVVLVEADGSRQHPVKAPAPHEPVVPEETDMVVGVVGLSALGKPVDQETVHRVALFKEITGAEPGQQIVVDHLAALISHPGGLFKDAPVTAAKLLLLNQADSPATRRAGERLARLVMNGPSTVDRTVIAQFDPVACRLKWGEKRCSQSSY